MRIRTIQVSLDIVLLAVTFAAALIAPYTKVEESFNVQAVHDIINIGLEQLERFDHVSFPGVVKRSSIGALALSLPSMFIQGTIKRWSDLIVDIAVWLHTILPTSTSSLYRNPNELRELFLETKMQQLLFTRCLLGLFTSCSMIYLRRSLTFSCSMTSKLIGIWFSLLFYPLPHIIFYSSRLLPNFICFPLVNVALGMFISGDIARSVSLLTFTGVVFRFELLIFTGILVLFCISGILRNGKPILSIRESIISVSIAALFASFLTARIDSTFWDVSFTIPELESFAFNVIDDGSKAWGVEPWYTYFTKYIPKLFASQLFITPLLVSLFFILSSFNVKNIFIKDYKTKPYKVDYVNYGVGTLTTLAWSAFTYLVVLSINGHKEWRFAVYIIPIFCAVAASTFEWILEKIMIFANLQRLFITFISGTYLISLFASMAFAIISSWNYVGGETAQRVNEKILQDYKNGGMLKPITIHWDVGTCMNGASLFTQIADNKLLRSSWLPELPNDDGKYWIIYDKTEEEDMLIEVANVAKYWIQYDDEPLIDSDTGEWVLVDVVEGVTGINVEQSLEIIKDPITLINEALQGHWKWFANAFDRCLRKSVRGKVYERI